MVELVHLYSNQHSLAKQLQRLHATATSIQRLHQQPVARQRQVRLNAQQIKALVKEYRAGASAKELAQRFGIHRTTASAILLRQGIEPRH